MLSEKQHRISYVLKKIPLDLGEDLFDIESHYIVSSAVPIIKVRYESFEIEVSWSLYSPPSTKSKNLLLQNYHTFERPLM